MVFVLQRKWWVAGRIALRRLKGKRGGESGIERMDRGGTVCPGWSLFHVSGSRGQAVCHRISVSPRVFYSGAERGQFSYEWQKEKVFQESG